MDKKAEILCLIPARGGSKGIPGKNMAKLCSKPLLYYTFNATKNSSYISRTILSTDDTAIAEYGKTSGIEVHKRPKELAGDDTPMKDVIKYHLSALEKEGYVPDVFILLQPTSPLRTEKHVDEALQALLNDDAADAIVSVVDVPHQYLPMKIMEKDETGAIHFYAADGEKYTTRQKLPRLYARNGAAIYAVYLKAFKETGSLYGKRCLPYEMKQEESVDVDTPFDLYIAECLMWKRMGDIAMKEGTFVL